MTPTCTGLSTIAAHSLHPKPGEVDLLAAALVDADQARPRCCRCAGRRHRHCGRRGIRPVTVVLGRASVAESAAVTVDAAIALNRSKASARRRCVAAMCTAPSTWVWPWPAPRASWSAGCDAFDQVPTEVGMNTIAMPEAAASGDLDVLVLLGSDPLSDVPDADLAERGLYGAGTVIAVEFAQRRPCPRRPRPARCGTAEVDGTFTNLEVARSPSEGHPPAPPAPTG